MKTDRNREARRIEKTTRPMRQWFVVGFVVTFLLLLCFIDFLFHIDGNIVECCYWKFYWLSIQQAVAGPAVTSRGTPVFKEIVGHVSLSCVGGLVVMPFAVVARHSRK